MDKDKKKRSEHVLELAGVYKSFSNGLLGRRQAVLSDLSMDVRRGEVFGLLGHNGAGKTTTLKIALGVLREDGGTVRLFGQGGVSREAKARVGYLSDNIGLYPGYTAVDMMRFAGELYRLDGAALRQRMADLLELVGLAEHSGRKINKYSRGMRQRLGVALAIINNPDLLILDEPYSGLDPIGRRDVRKLLLSLKERGTTIVISSHIVPDVEAVCDRIGVLKEGRIEKCLELRDIYRQKSADVEVTLAGVGVRDIIGRETGVRLVYSTKDAVVLRCDGTDATNAIIRRTLDRGGRVVELRPLRFNLEDYVFESLTENVAHHKGDMFGRKTTDYAHS